MIYLFGQLLYPHPWIPLALVLGWIIGWYSCGTSKPDA